MTRRTAALVLAFALLLGLIVASALLPVPYVRFAPGPVYNTIGSLDGTELISISGTTTHQTSGNLDMTTVSESGGPYGNLTVADVLRTWRDPNVRMLPREQVFPEEVDRSQVQTQNSVAFDESQSAAISASMRYLNKPLTSSVLVTDVSINSPANTVILPRDVITAIAGTTVHTHDEVAAVVRSKPVGTALPFAITRDGKPMTVTVTSGPRPDDPNVPYVGIGTATNYQASFPIVFGVKDVGGPSAGLMFTLGIVDKLTTGNLNGGKHVAGTGTISPEGKVGAIGGIAQKMAGARNAGAELFLAPDTNCNEVVNHIPDGLTVAKVSTLTDAVAATEAWVAGRPVPSCS